MQRIQKWRKREKGPYCQETKDKGFDSELDKKISTEMQIKTTMRYYFTPFRMAVNKKIKNNKCL